MRRALYALIAALCVFWALRSRSQGHAPQGSSRPEPTLGPGVSRPAGTGLSPRAQGTHSASPMVRASRETIPRRSPSIRPDDPGPGPWIELYNGRSGALSPHARPDGAEVVTTLRSEGPAPFIEAWVLSTRVDAGAEVVIYARARGIASRPIEVQSAGVYVYPRGSPERGQSATMARAQEGQRQDFEHRYQAPREVSATNAPLAIDYAVRVQGRYDGRAFERMVPGGFRVHAPGATLDPRAMSTAREAGDLVLSVRVAVTVAGTYGLYAELWGSRGEAPIGFARERFDGLSTGSHALSVRFGGQILRDRGIDGPYVLRNVRWSSGATIPPHEQRPAGPIETQAFRAEDFW